MSEEELWERFLMSWNLPGFPGFGMMDSGAVWNGPIRSSVSDLDKGPRYLPKPNSWLRMLANTMLCCLTEGLLGGVYV